MNSTHDSTLDPATASAASTFVTRVAALYPVSGAILFGSRVGCNYRHDSNGASPCSCVASAASSSIPSCRWRISLLYYCLVLHDSLLKGPQVDLDDVFL